MFRYGLTKKQCGVIFANIKSGKLNLSSDFSKWMYSSVADARVFADSTVMCDVFDRMRHGLDAIFAGDIETAAEELDGAYTVYHAHYTTK